MKQIFILLLLISGFSYSSLAQDLADDIDISGSSNGIIDLPSDAPAAFANGGIVKYTKIQAPNGQAIHFVAQNLITDAQIVRARNILQFYLTNLPGSEYGADKTAVMNQMGTNEAILMLLNGSDGDFNIPNINGQPLYQNEMAVEGHQWYINNEYDEHRDASFEEILHMMHDTGIGVDGPNTMSGALPDYQSEIRDAQDNADNGFAIWPLGANSGGIQDWYNELSQENSLSQEYLASVIDSYYGLWGAWTESSTTGMWGLYIAKTREEIETEDPMGYALMPKFFSPFININMDIDPSFSGTFTMAFDDAQAYTHKSQYLQHCSLTGTNAANLKGNDEYNRLNGNDADNELEGLKGNDRLDGNAGTDVAIFTGNQSEYTLNTQALMTIITDNISDRDGVDTLFNIEIIRFADIEVGIATNIQHISADQVFNVFPNPTNEYITLEWIQRNPIKQGVINLYDQSGKLVQETKLETFTENIKLNVKDLPSGIYSLQLIGDGQFSSEKIVIQ